MRAVVVQRGGRQLTAGVAALRAGDLTIVEAGAFVPADGVVLEGTATIDEVQLTGERDVADKAPGQLVYAGTRVVTGRLVFEITRGERDSMASEVRRHLLAATRIAPEDLTPGETLGRRTAAPVLALSAVGGLTGGLGTVSGVLAPRCRTYSKRRWLGRHTRDASAGRRHSRTRSASAPARRPSAPRS